MNLLNLASIVPCTESDGSGKRFALWAQGCLKRCPGCCNPHMFELAPKHVVPCGAVVAQVLHARTIYQIVGVTFLGGEPMLQVLVEPLQSSGQSIHWSCFVKRLYAGKREFGLASSVAAVVLVFGTGAQQVSQYVSPKRTRQ